MTDQILYQLLLTFVATTTNVDQKLQLFPKVLMWAVIVWKMGHLIILPAGIEHYLTKLSNFDVQV